MTDLDKLLAKAKTTKISPAEEEAQRRSFAYGNTNIENSRITHSIVAEADEALKKQAVDDKAK